MIGRETAKTLTLYSGRDEKFVLPAVEAFEQKTGIKVTTLYAGASELLIRLMAEGKISRCDVYLTNDAVTLERARNEGLLTTIDAPFVDDIPASFRASDNSWVGVSFRTRAIVYNKNLVDAEEVVSTFDLANPKWRGRVATVTSANASFISGIATLIRDFGEDKTRTFLAGLKENSRRLVLPKHTPVVRAVAEGDASLGYINHYYFYRHLAKHPDAPIGLIFPDQDSKGTAWNIAGVGLVRSAKNASGAHAFIRFLLSEKGQKIFTEKNFEYPTNPHAKLHRWVPDRNEFKLSQTAVNDMAITYVEAIDLIQSLGLE